MCGKNKGVVALVSKAVENDGGSKPLVLHCIIHQQSLCGKCLDMSEVLKPVISVVNFIRSTGLNHRQFHFDVIANEIKLFQNPFDSDIETLAPEVQMEIIDLQCSVI
ncbi:general transcription factor II-I repeat domain-containing protein 2 [Trichonephila inaurata madagascariensis]|uniref:General transcription factor II-I repeat domain-containing protein 2 n=1 Tax=Trichonephila inaurata madagascariensis TaxID=2747483 RepID=A0A8X6YUK7_9ARAC|nr:general transcription factor II-I repeat domain-containing protein 2 [Trichonephila inaurata madagascariensis]